MIKHLEACKTFSGKWYGFIVMESGKRVQLDGYSDTPDTWADKAKWLGIPFVQE